MMGAGGLAIEEKATNDQIETAVVPASSRRTRTSAVKPDVALEWSNIQIKFRVVSQDFYSNNDLYDLFPDVDPQAPSYRYDEIYTYVWGPSRACVKLVRPLFHVIYLYEHTHLRDHRLQ